MSRQVMLRFLILLAFRFLIRPDLLAIFPHAVAGRKLHYRESVTAWKWMTIILKLGMIFLWSPWWVFDFSRAGYAVDHAVYSDSLRSL